MNRDWNALRSHHLESPKFTKITIKGARYDFEEMIAAEIANTSAMLEAVPDLTVDLRDQKIDVFGDTAVETALLVGTGTLPTGARMELTFGVSSVWVRTDAGWKIAHEHATEPERDIVDDPFADERSAIEAQMLGLNDVVGRRDWDALRAIHLESPKFTKFGKGPAVEDFEEMITGETARMSARESTSVDWRNLKIDVFGDVAVSTSTPRFTLTETSGEATEHDLRSTMVWVKTVDGWKIAHEHNSQAQEE